MHFSDLFFSRLANRKFYFKNSSYSEDRKNFHIKKSWNLAGVESFSIPCIAFCQKIEKMK